ncbi:Bug family tripartite tricarboxylate transporter substrate binding protein [Xylophilus sp.]|uniref:Bug family tripartite tricarboxylate transporter substrate binding protein n=1 Tax=Xylophilus sp. TaxID=2653893 RepID=UPI0013BB9022|nr:tripartite tricarboxylate transporter substrate binding protein [Xylophilus sp.]KAF1044871.1 MAG: hypothetical protein GAK38_03343 [Xylophilus sp.]
MDSNRRSLLLGAAGLAAGTAAFAQPAKWPARPIKLIVSYPPGGSSNIIARAISQPLSDALGQPIVVENRAGANGNLGADFVAKAPGDGYNLLLCDTGSLAISPSVYTKLPFDPSRDLRGVAMLAYSPHLLVVHPSVKAHNLKELVALSKTSDLNFAVTASGSAAHLAGLELAAKTGAKWEYVPYKGGVQSVQDTVAGQTQILMNGMLATYPHVQSGRLKLLGVSKATRMPLIGNVPTIAEQGVPGYETGSWQGVLAPRDTPDAVVQRVSQELRRIIRSADVRERLIAQGAEVSTQDPAQFDAFFAKERARWAQVVKATGVKLD